MSRTRHLFTAGITAVYMVVAAAQAAATIGVKTATNHKGISISVYSNPSTNPPTPLQNLGVSLNNARTGTIQSPGSPLPATSSLGILAPGPDGYGSAATFDVFYTGPASDFPTNSFFDVFAEFTDPNTDQPGAMTKGTVKFFNEQKGFGMVANTSNPGLTFSLVGFAQTGLSFSDVQIVQPNPIDPNANSFFDIFTELRFDGSGSIDTSIPLFEFTTTATTPEPSTRILAMAGLAGLLLAAYKRRLAT